MEHDSKAAANGGKAVTSVKRELLKALIAGLEFKATVRGYKSSEEGKTITQESPSR